MGLPEPSSLSLFEAVQRVAHRCSVTPKEARAALDRAFRSPSRDLVPTDPRGRMIEDWDGAVVDWQRSSIGSRASSGDGGHLTGTLENVSLSTWYLDEWMGWPTSRTPDSSSSAGPRATDQFETQSTNVRHAPRPKRKRAAPAKEWANKAIDTLWPSGDIPPEPAIAIHKIREWTATKDRRGVPISPDVIRHVLRSRRAS